MVQKPWFKLFVWFISTFFFFVASGVVIALSKPGASEMEAMKYMSGMMGAMETSIMGAVMEVEENSQIGKILAYSYFLLGPALAISIVAGFAIRLICRGGKSVS